MFFHDFSKEKQHFALPFDLFSELVQLVFAAAFVMQVCLICVWVGEMEVGSFKKYTTLPNTGHRRHLVELILKLYVGLL